MGWIIASGLISRVVGPFWTVHAYYDSPELDQFMVVFGGTGALFLVALVVMLISYSHLRPFRVAESNSPTINRAYSDNEALIGD